MEEHFKGIVPEERWKNEILQTLRDIKELLSSDSKTTKQETTIVSNVATRQTNRRSAK